MSEIFKRPNITAHLDNLLTRGYEDEVVEFKEAKTQYDFNKLGKYFSALCNEANLNSKPLAWLVFGIRDKDKMVVDTKFRTDPAKLNSIKPEIANHTTGRITFKEIHEVNTSEGRVLLFEIPAAPQGIPIAWKGHYYGRDGEELGALNTEEYERIRGQILVTDWSAEIIESATLEDLALEAILKARENYKTKNTSLISQVDKWNDSTFLNKAKLTIKGRITKAAILLLGKPESDNFITPSTSKISWILRDNDNIEKDYEHFSCPLIINTEKIYQKIRNLRYRYIKENTLFPDEVDQYDPFIIREALNNSIAHQDYRLRGKISLVEYEEGKLIFANLGKFIPRSVEDVVISDSPEPTYRNTFLVEAMININMIDAIGSGIKKMYLIQKNKYFPLPDYDITNNSVKVTITGKIVDLNYARKLATTPNLDLSEILNLDKIAKGKTVTPTTIKRLKAKNLIEGRKPNYYISSSIAYTPSDKAKYIKQRGFKDKHYKKMILEYIDKFGSATREDIRDLIKDQLPNVLTDEQKTNKVRNIIQAMSKKDGTITNKGSSRQSKWEKVLLNE